jgi:hypothetical protein
MFKPGQSGNPGGMPKGAREVRFKVAAALDERFTQDGQDRLVDALVLGVEAGDATCIKLACEYRWGKPVTQLELSGPDGEPLRSALDLSRLSDAELATMQQLTAKAKTKGEGENG